MPSVIGRIREKWLSVGGAQGFLGEPLTDELPTPDSVGRFNHFQHGSIYWTPHTDAHEVHGAIRDLWAKCGWEMGHFGYPVSDEEDAGGGTRISRFQRGAIHWHPNRKEPSVPNTPYKITVHLNQVVCRTTESIHSSDKFVMAGAVLSQTDSKPFAFEQMRINDNEVRDVFREIFSGRSAKPEIGIACKAWDIDENNFWFDNKDKVAEVTKLIGAGLKLIPGVGEITKIVFDAGAVIAPVLVNEIFKLDKPDLLGELNRGIVLPEPGNHIIVHWNEEMLCQLTRGDYSIFFTVFCEIG